jgi:hypothetical protein
MKLDSNCRPFFCVHFGASLVYRPKNENTKRRGKEKCKGNGDRHENYLRQLKPGHQSEKLPDDRRWPL